ncbi:MAG: Do family serine endopeptidase [Alistipes sp.]|nr:Do family serine endopeptidase [Alistipes sp.]MBR3792578.1 Do family serine endopeptidase [Alistipes sp.]
MKKTALVILSAAAVSALAGGLTALSVNKYMSGRVFGGSDNAVVDWSDTTPRAGNHFASYQAEQYPDLTYAAENAVKAVVNIESIREVQYGGRSRGYDPFYEFFGIPYGGGGYSEPQTREQRSGGSGVIISADGYIVTNNHVIEDATKLKVKLNDGRTFDAKLIGTDPTTDVALIKIEEENLPTLAFGNSNDLRLGEWVLAIGSPFDLQSTITAGIVSAKARQLGVIPDELRVESFIQTDAAVNPGNSGGALVNIRGELVGINTVIKSSTGSYVGYSFAVPETIVRKVVVDLKEYGVVQRAMLGIRYRAIDDLFIEQLGEELGISKTGGLYVDEVVEGGAAEDAGLRKGDIITAVDGKKVNDASSMSEQMAQYRPGDKISIEYDRNGTAKKAQVTLKNKVGKAEPVTADTKDVAEALGGEFADVSQSLREKLEIRGGVQVTSVERDGLLAQSGVKEGFVITYINDRPITSLKDLDRVGDSVESIDGVYTNGRAVRYVIVK